MSASWGPEQGGGRVQPRHVIAAAALRCGASVAMMTGRTRRAQAARARWVAMAVMHGRLGMSSVAIGHELGGRDHSTVLHGLAQVEGWLSAGRGWSLKGVDGFDDAALLLEKVWSYAVVLALREAEAALRAEVAAATGGGAS